jgi:uncharacterized protein (TIGR00255 family)
MIRSMTGFGEAVVQAGVWSVRVRVRTLNHRGMRLNFHFPEEFSWRAAEMRGLVGQYLKRGTIDIWLRLTSESEVEGVTIDDDAAKRYAEKLRELQLKLGLSGGIDLGMVVGLPGVVRGVELETTDELWELARAAVREALAKAAEMRRVEGEALAEELLSVASRIEVLVVEAEGRAPGVVEAYKARLLARLRCLTEGEEERLSEQDIMREVVLFADRADIAEELCRLRSHIDVLRETVESDEPEGRRLEFIGQEMLREASTLSAKANDSMLSQISVSLRTEIERIKEQVGNVE